MSNINLPTGRDMVSLLGEDFFNEETRCEYHVSELMKKLWAISIDLYLEFSRICDKHGLKYFAYAGTLLGAVRHEGFIPWDDDMDVGMLRNDYERFIKIAPSELKEPYLLQTPFTEVGYFRTITRLSNTKTTRIPRFFKHSGMSHGMMLDIFPLDDYDEATHELDMKEIALSAKKCSQYLKRNDTNIMTPEHYSSWEKYMTDEPLAEWTNVQETAKKHNSNNADFCCMKVLTSSENIRCNNPLKKEWFEHTKEVPFEKIKIQIPIGYDGILKTHYGDYMKFPPVNQRVSGHYGLEIDPEKPYTEYLP